VYGKLEVRQPKPSVVSS